MKKIPGFSGLYATRDGRFKPKGKNPRSLMTISCIQADYLLEVPRSVIKLKYNVSDFSITMYTKRFRT